MKYKAIVFDLDGTLTDTLEDLLISTNHALSACGMPERTYQEVRSFVGNGVRLLIERAVPDGTPVEEVDRCFGIFKEHYMVHCQDHTGLYPGVAEMLEQLHAAGFLLAIVSNKLQAGVDELYETFFRQTVRVAIGERPGMACKPAPDMVELALKELGVSRSDAVYVGDSDVDLQTARNSGLPCISVLWGFRDRDFLQAEGAQVMIEKPEEIMDLVR